MPVLTFHKQFPYCDSPEKGAITIAETLIALVIGLAVITVWAQSRLNHLEVDNAKSAGRAISTYSRAASVWLTENPPTASGIFDINNLQDCTDANGARFLSCSYNAQTVIRFATDAVGNPVNFGNLDIDVTVTGAGETARIDFGIFRSGDDRNNDGLADSRPDLAAIAFQTASEETGAGVLGFFELEFARENPDGLVFDSNDAAFDQDEVDNLARIVSRIGANVNDVPFLRLDGTNEMTGGITFNNGMQMNMDGIGLSFDGPGNIEVQTNTGTLVVSQNLRTASLESDSAEFEILESDNAEFDVLSVEPVDGVSGAGFDRFNQAPDIVRIDGDILSLSTRVATNETEIANNASEIVSLTGDVNNNSQNINNNQSELNTHNLSITDNTSRIQALEDEDTSTNPVCTPSRLARISEMAGKGYRNYYDLATSSGNCNTGVDCHGRDRCDDTVTGTIQLGSSWQDNPVQYSGRNPLDLSCKNYSINFYSGCSCVLPTPVGCH